jgi:hypothetical protein
MRNPKIPRDGPSVPPDGRNGGKINWNAPEKGGSASGELLATIGTAALILAKGGDLLEQGDCGTTV